jgi:hypothetical protein
MIAILLLLIHGAFIVSVLEEWRDRGLTDTSYRVLAMMLAASLLGFFAMPAEYLPQSLEALSAVSTKLISFLTGVVYVYWMLAKLSNLATRYLHRRDPLRHLGRQNLYRQLLRKR